MLDGLQQSFLDAIRGTTTPPALGPSRVSAAQTWAIYRRNYEENHIGALADTYSTVEKLVGDGYFRQLARRYVASHESRSGDLNDYGDDFAEFLFELLPKVPGGTELPYLHDIARFDWAWFEALRASEAAGAGLGELLEWPVERWGEARARPHPACRLLRSDYPIDRILRVAAGELQTVDLACAGDALLINRPDIVRVTCVGPSQALFVERWLSGTTLADALDAALALDSVFDLQNILSLLMTLGAVSRIERQS